MSNLHYSRKKRQLENLSKKINALIVSGKWSELPSKVKGEIIRKINLLVDLLRKFISKRELKRILATAVVLIGLTRAEAQTFDPPIPNPFNIPVTNYITFIETADLDNDGDMDLIISDQDPYSGSNDYTRVRYFENVGTPEVALFGPGQEDYVDFPPVPVDSYVYFRVPILSDIDSDGDVDLLFFEGGYDYSTGQYLGWQFFENVGTPEIADLAFPQTDPFGLTDNGYVLLPTLADIDGDGDQDLFYIDPEYGYAINFQENIGDATTPNFDAVQLNPFGISPTDYISFPGLGDIDLDGDLDLMTTGQYGTFYFFENTGNINLPVFAAPVPNPFGLMNTSEVELFELVDINNDGDLDIISPNITFDDSTTVNFYRNTALTGLDDLTEKIIFDVFPNPSIDGVNVVIPELFDLTSTTIELFDSKGSLVLQKIDLTRFVYVDLNAFSAGAYSMVIRDEDQWTSKKIIKE